jgi:hypothetical protein
MKDRAVTILSALLHGCVTRPADDAARQQVLQQPVGVP